MQKIMISIALNVSGRHHLCKNTRIRHCGSEMTFDFPASIC